MSTIPPIRRQVLVDADPQSAFEAFTARIGRWWPLAELSVHGTGGTVGFEDGQIIERSADGVPARWGTVTRWDPPGVLAFSWHPGRAADRASQVEITFTAAEDGQTLVTLEHAGWEVFADPAAARAEYDHGWPEGLHLYQEFADAQGSAPENGAAWVALMHRPGPAMADGPVTEQPLFREHAAFLGRMAASGYLVAAGPLLPPEPHAPSPAPAARATTIPPRRQSQNGR